MLRMSNLKDYKYDLYWEKEAPTNVLQLKKRFGKNIETISVFYKKQCTYNPYKIRWYDKLGLLSGGSMIVFVIIATVVRLFIWICVV